MNATGTKNRSIHIPVKNYSVPRSELKRTVPAAPKCSRDAKRVLLVDDDPAVRDSLDEVLQGEGYFVMQAQNGEEALELANRLTADIVLLDLKMPVKDGWDAFNQLTLDHPFTPIIITPARSNQLITSISAGAGALLEKPLDIPALLQTMEKLLAESVQQRRARRDGIEAGFVYTPAPAKPVAGPRAYPPMNSPQGSPTSRERIKLLLRPTRPCAEQFQNYAANGRADEAGAQSPRGPIFHGARAQ